MHRSKKFCVYRDCTINSQTHPELTLFQFPKSDERTARWCELGAVDPADVRPQFMCELHFSRIYMCFSSRRKMLLNTAIPYAYGGTEQDQQGHEEVQSSSSMHETEDISIEEHLDESTIDEDDDEATEIVYVHPEEEDPIRTDELIEPLFSKKRSASTETQVYPKIIKVEKISPISHSMLVSSSSPCTEGALKPITPPKGTILRKVKLKKRSVAPKSFVNKTIQPSSSAQSTSVEPTPTSTAELTVSSSPEKKAPSTITDSDAADEELQKEPHSSPKKDIEPVASSSNSVVVVGKIDDVLKPVKKEDKPPEKSSSPVKKDDPIYEFIFKGEEYVQLPKAKYYGEQKELQQRLKQCESEKTQMLMKVEHYRRTIGELKKLLANIDDTDNDETVE